MPFTVCSTAAFWAVICWEVIQTLCVRSSQMQMTKTMKSPQMGLSKPKKKFTRPHNSRSSDHPSDTVETRGSNNIIKMISQLFCFMLFSYKLSSCDSRIAPSFIQPYILEIRGSPVWKESLSLPRAPTKILESLTIGSDWFGPCVHFWNSLWPGLSNVLTLEGRVNIIEA